MKVMLLVPTMKYGVGEYPSYLSLSDFPTGVAYLASALKQAGHTVVSAPTNNTIGYVNAPTMLKSVLTQALKEHQPELIGMGGLCTDYKFFKDAIAIIREVLPEAKIVLGGNIVTNDAEDIFEILKPDYAIVGDGEEAIVRLCECIQNNCEPSDLFPNIWYWREA